MDFPLNLRVLSKEQRSGWYQEVVPRVGDGKGNKRSLVRNERERERELSFLLFFLSFSLSLGLSQVPFALTQLFTPPVLSLRVPSSSATPSKVLVLTVC